jgi:hypothetical protein
MDEFTYPPKLEEWSPHQFVQLLIEIVVYALHTLEVACRCLYWSGNLSNTLSHLPSYDLLEERTAWAHSISLIGLCSNTVCT